ncbi:MAG TPA: IclR family transcriptional regulator [Clostridia bacterium]|nr:IclR family transcriptional regulator [Clostridia bacterium]
MKALENALTVLLAFGDDKKELSLAEVAARTKLGKSGVCKVLATFKRYGFVRQNPVTKAYSLGYRLMALGAQALSDFDAREVAKPYLKLLVEEFGENAQLMILDEQSAVIIEQVESPNIIRLSMKMGKRYPLHCGAGPKLLLAFCSEEQINAYIASHGLDKWTENTITSRDALMERLAQIRRDGYCISQGEFDPDAVAYAVPVRNAEGTVIAAIAVSGPRNRMIQWEEKGLLPRLLEVGREVSKELGYMSPGGGRSQ